MTIQTILSKFDKVRNAGTDKYRVKCPVHNGKDFNMLISERSDLSVGAHCFVCGAQGPELVQALGLPMKEIFAPESEYVRPVVTKKMEQEALEDAIVLDIAKDQQHLSLADKRRIRLAKARLERINELKSA